MAVVIAVTSLQFAGLHQQASAASLSYPADFTLAGNATNPSTGVIQLTPNSNGQKGAVFSKSRLSVNSAFTITADIYWGNSDAGADGVAFVLQPNSTTTLSSGGGLGYDGVTNAFAVEFDTYNNYGQEGAADHAGLMKSTASNHSEWTTSSSVYNFGVNIEDNKWRAFEVIWTPAASATATCGASSGKGTLKVLFDINADGSKDTLYNNVCIDLQTYFKSV